MTSSDDWRKTVRLNKLLGMWAAEKLGITGPDAEAYSDALAVGTLDPERSDVLSKIRRDFDAAGVAQSDEQILRVLNELTLQAREPNAVTAGRCLRCLNGNARPQTQAGIKPAYPSNRCLRVRAEAGVRFRDQKCPATRLLIKINVRHLYDTYDLSVRA